MKYILKFFKWLGISILSLLIVVFAVLGMFFWMSPQFGGAITHQQRLSFANTGHFDSDEGIFLNDEEIKMEINCHSIEKMIKEMMSPDPNVSPKQNIEVVKVASDVFNYGSDSEKLARFTWFGHSTYLVELEGKKLLFDPVFSQYAAPHPWLGRKRYHREMPIYLEDLPSIDAVIISHDHYDHLDYESIQVLKAKTKHFFVPLGVGNHLLRWEIESKNITEMDWWDEHDWNGLKIAFTPSRHMSGRGLGDQSTTLWGSWVLVGKQRKVYFSGDGGYGKHFKEIGEKYGPFDLGMIECGQYNKLWENVHMMPEQSVLAAQDVKARAMVPIHWGAFTLATHAWTDPIVRVTKKAEELKMTIATPRIGEQFHLTDSNTLFPNTRWWEEYQ